MTPQAPFDAERPNIARMHDYLLGGSRNFDADRIAAREFQAKWPGAAEAMRLNRAFAGRAVRFLAQAGVRQFPGIGSGIPAAGNVHEVAQGHAADARVVYAGNDEVAVLHPEATWWSATAPPTARDRTWPRPSAMTTRPPRCRVAVRRGGYRVAESPAPGPAWTDQLARPFLEMSAWRSARPSQHPFGTRTDFPP